MKLTGGDRVIDKSVYLFSIILYFGRFSLVWSLFEECNHLIELKNGQKIYINSPYYPAEYPIGTSCRYTVHAPLDHQLSFRCTVNLNVDSSKPRCQSEVFTFNSEGNEILTESNFYCANAYFERKSFLNRATISYISQPTFRRNLIPITATPVYNDDNEDRSDNEGNNNDDYAANVQRDVITTMPSMLEADLRQENFPNAFTMLTEMLSKAVSESIDELETTPITTVSPVSSSTTVEGEIPRSSWRRRFKSVDDEKAGYSKRHQRIVAYNSSLNNNGQLDGNTGNRGGGGGRFSCLIEVIEQPCDCGWSLSLKVAGATGVAGINEFPSMAGVKTVRFNQIFCGAAIISHRYLVSAAHCFLSADTNRSDLISAVVGENDFSTVLESLYTRTFEIDAIIPHELFRTNSRNQRNDIALLRTRLPIEWNRNVGPACLPFLVYNIPGTNLRRKLPLPGQRVETAGWGTTSFGGAQSTQLLKTTLDILPTDNCRRILQTALPTGVFCTYTPGRDTCQYDSGGALYVRTHRLYAVGIISYGFACAAQQPSVNTRIASYTDWIRSKTPDARYCIK